MRLSEAFDSIHPVEVLTHNKNTIVSRFTSPSGERYIVKFERINWLSNPTLGNSSVWVFSFDNVHSPEVQDDVEHEPHFMSVMSTVLSILRSNITKSDAELVIFISLDKDLTRLYNRIGNKVRLPHGYSMFHHKHRVDAWVIKKDYIEYDDAVRISNSVTKKNYGF